MLFPRQSFMKLASFLTFSFKTRHFPSALLYSRRGAGNFKFACRQSIDSRNCLSGRVIAFSSSYIEVPRACYPRNRRYYRMNCPGDCSFQFEVFFPSFAASCKVTAQQLYRRYMQLQIYGRGYYFLKTFLRFFLWNVVNPILKACKE